MSAPSPGWYADPSGQGVWRYWDGAAWTEHRSPAAPPAAPAPAPEPLLPPLGDSTLLYLFASRLYKGRPLVGLRVPCPPRRVNGPQLATEMLALAWWSLREAG